MIDTTHQKRYIGRLMDGPKTADDLLKGADWRDTEAERLARYVEQGYIVRKGENRYGLNIPVVNSADDGCLTEAVDRICEDLAGQFLDRALSRFAEKIGELGFEHLLREPHYVGFLGFLIAGDEVVRKAIETGLLIRPDKPGPAFGAWAWYEAPRLMRGWSRGR